MMWRGGAADGRTWTAGGPLQQQQHGRTSLLLLLTYITLLLLTSSTCGILGDNDLVGNRENRRYDESESLEKGVSAHAYPIFPDKRSISSLFSEYLIHKAPNKQDIFKTPSLQRSYMSKYFARTNLAQGLGKREDASGSQMGDVEDHPLSKKNLMNLFSQRLGSSARNQAVSPPLVTIQELLENMRKAAIRNKLNRPIAVLPSSSKPSPDTGSGNLGKTKSHIQKYFPKTSLASSLG